MYLFVRLARLAGLAGIFILLLWNMMPNHGSSIVLGWAGGVSTEHFLNYKYPLTRLKKTQNEKGSL